MSASSHADIQDARELQAQTPLMNSTLDSAKNAGGSLIALPRMGKIVREATGLLRRPQRFFPLIKKVASDGVRMIVPRRHLYSYSSIKRASAEVASLSVRWILNAQRVDGGIAAYYSLLTGYSRSYPEVTGYIIPTLYDCARLDCIRRANENLLIESAERATDWLLSLQTPSGAFPGGLQGSNAGSSVFNTGQVVHGLVRASYETGQGEILSAARRAGDWLVETQRVDGSWSGSGAYQNDSHTYYTMVAWALALLYERDKDLKYASAAERNLDWALSNFSPSGWIDGLNLRTHPNYLHFIAYVLQGALECAIVLRRTDAIEAVAGSAWVLLRKFETNKYLAGAYDRDFTHERKFSCLTGNAQMSCVWARLFQVTGDLRYLNAALKMNEMLKQSIPLRGGFGIAGGLSGSYPVWGGYQPLRYISWGCKFLIDALVLELRITKSFERSASEALPCAS